MFSLRNVFIALIVLSTGISTALYSNIELADEEWVYLSPDSMAIRQGCPELGEHPFPKGTSTASQELLTVLSWNIYKQQRLNWQPALIRYAADSELMLLQEVVDGPSELEYLNYSSWAYAPAFLANGKRAGVMTLSRHPIHSVCEGLTSEPLIRFPKAGLVTRIEWQQQPLYVVNMHGINFTPTVSHLLSQINELMGALPPGSRAIFAGDFNTWSDARTSNVRAVMAAQGFIEVIFNEGEDHRTEVFGRPLDMMFYRGLELVSMTSEDVDSSDHNPIIAEFRAQTGTSVVRYLPVSESSQSPRQRTEEQREDRR